VHHLVDYLGAATLTLAASGLVLFASLGGTTYKWGSWPMVLMGGAGVALLGVFALVERRAAEPVLPLHLFANRTFSVTSVVGFIVGFTMFGAITYLPVFFQVVRGMSPTASGVELLPLMAGLLVVSTASGQVIAKTGKYRFFPIAGSAVTALGLYLLSRVSLGTPTSREVLYMLVFGLGLGGVMQVLVIVVQNAVPHSELGVATSGATFFRSIGGSFGTAVFGAIFSNVLLGNLVRDLHKSKLPGGLASADITPALLSHLPTLVRHGLELGYAQSVQAVFVVSVPIAVIAFVAAWFVPHVELRRWVSDATGRKAGTEEDGSELARVAIEV
jgi:hypothetical protein